MSGQRVVIAGGHGQIAHHLIDLLAAAGDHPVALIRNPRHTDDVQTWGAEALVLDLENAGVDDVAAALGSADAAVFAAGAGPGSGPARKDTVDRAASVHLADAAERAGVRRFVQISAFGAGEPVAADRDETWAAYIAAKTAAEEDLRARSALDWTILRPGLLTNAAATGLVTLRRPPLDRGKVTRADVAAVIAALLGATASFGETLLLTEGDTPVAKAVEQL
ncbi:MAG TPA: NAD(P)H-binding protein [Aldersonia sp.]